MNMDKKLPSLLSVSLGVVVLGASFYTMLKMKHATDLMDSLMGQWANVSFIISGLLVWSIITWDLRKLSEAEWYKGMSRSVTYLGAAGSVIGLMKVMTSLDKPELIGPGIAVAFGCFIISFLFAFVLSQIAISKSTSDSEVDFDRVTVFPLISFMSILCVVFIVLFALKKECYEGCQLPEREEVGSSHADKAEPERDEHGEIKGHH